MGDELSSPNTLATNFEIEIKFGTEPLFPYPGFVSLISPPPSPSVPSQYLDRLNTLGYTEPEQASIFKHELDSALIYDTTLPAFHWDVDALKSNAKDWLGSESGSVLEEIEKVVGPMVSTAFPKSSSKSVDAVAASDPPVADGSDEVTHSVVINVDPREIISDDVKGEDIPRVDTPDFKMLRSSTSSNPPDNAPIPTNIPLPLSRLGSEDPRSKYYFNDVDWSMYMDIVDPDWYLLRYISALNCSSSSFDVTSFESDQAQLDPEESVSVEIEDIELKDIIGSSLATMILDLNVLDECIGQNGIRIVPDEDDTPVVLYSSSGQGNVQD